MRVGRPLCFGSLPRMDIRVEFLGFLHLVASLLVLNISLQYEWSISMAEGGRAETSEGTSASMSAHQEEDYEDTMLISLTTKLPRGFVGWVPSIDETF